MSPKAEDSTTNILADTCGVFGGVLHCQKISSCSDVTPRVCMLTERSIGTASSCVFLNDSMLVDQCRRILSDYNHTAVLVCI